jgi:hypothetical protein
VEVGCFPGREFGLVGLKLAYLSELFCGGGEAGAGAEDAGAVGH